MVLNSSTALLGLVGCICLNKYKYRTRIRLEIKLVTEVIHGRNTGLTGWHSVICLFSYPFILFNLQAAEYVIF